MLRRTLLRGLFVLGLLVFITYIAKFKPRTPQIVARHNLAGWVFKEHGRLSVLIIYPNDKNSQNSENNGERIFVNPLDNPTILAHNYIRYPLKTLYLIGQVNVQHVSAYCGWVDSSSILFFSGPGEWATQCPRSKSIALSYPQGDSLTVANRLDSGRMTQDWSVANTYMRIISSSYTDSLFCMSIKYQGQSILIQNHTFLQETDSSLQVLVQTNGLASYTSVGGLYLSPHMAIHSGVTDSNLILTENNQSLGFYVDTSAKIRIKKLWLNSEKETLNW